MYVAKNVLLIFMAMYILIIVYGKWNGKHPPPTQNILLDFYFALA
jgi:hypothetical protein